MEFRTGMDRLPKILSKMHFHIVFVFLKISIATDLERKFRERYSARVDVMGG
jgi:hypothetical protein